MLGLFTTKLTAIIAAIMIACVGGWGAWQYVQLQKANVDRVSAIAERDKAGVERDKAIGVARENADTVTRLVQEKKDIEKSLANLAAARARDAVVIGDLKKIIDSQATNPENQVLLSPVLQAVLGKIQQERAKRAGVAK